MRNTRSAGCMACAVFVTMAVLALASGTARGDDHLVAGCAETTNGPADARGEIGAEDWQDEQGIAAELGENGTDGDHAAHGDDCAIGAAGPLVARTAPTGDDGAPTAHADSGQARAPPAPLSAPRTGPGA